MDVDAIAAQIVVLATKPKSFRVVRRLQGRLANEFARRRRWKRSRARTIGQRDDFSGEREEGFFGHRYPCLNPPFDHPYAFRDENGRLVLASHVYRDLGDAEGEAEDRRIAAEMGLTVEHVSDFPSWWYPGRTQLFVWRQAVPLQ
jgi:hypothetical protein